MAGFSGRLDLDRAVFRGACFGGDVRGRWCLSSRRGQSCSAIALRDCLDVPVLRSVLRLLRIDQLEQSTSEFTAQAEHVPAEKQPRRSLSETVKGATITAVQVGLTLTGAALHLASKVVAGLQERAGRLSERQQLKQQEAAARQEVADAQTRIQYEIKRQQLQKQGQDAAFVNMLHVLDRCHLDHDVKWALVQKHTADKAEFSERLSQLYKLAQASKDTVDHLLRPDATRKEINTFWKSPETVAIIAEEDKLKSLVFAQMLQATS